MRCAKLDGIAKPKPIEPASPLVPADKEAIMEFIPTRLPLISTNGPPELPGLTAASVWIASISEDCPPPWDARTGRLTAETIPEVTVALRPSGEPTATTSWPTCKDLELPNSKNGRSSTSLILITATS